MWGSKVMLVFPLPSSELCLSVLMFVICVHGVCLPTHKPHTVRAERVSLCLQCEFLHGQILGPPSAWRQTPPVSWQRRLLSVPPIRHDGCFFEGSRLSSRCPISGRLWLATLGWEVGEGGISHSADRADFFAVSVHWSPDTATKASLRVEDALPLCSVSSWSCLCLFYFIYCGWQSWCAAWQEYASLCVEAKRVIIFQWRRGHISRAGGLISTGAAHTQVYALN